MKQKLLLKRNVSKLGIVGDVVEVSAGYARNFLLPQGLATEPTEANMKALAEARRQAEEERIRERKMLESLAERLEGIEITIHAKANPDGHLYGSVGKREISAALRAEGHPVDPEQILLDHPIRHLDNVPVELRLDDGIRSNIKVWVVRERGEGEPEEDESGSEGAAGEPIPGGTEAATDDERSTE